MLISKKISKKTILLSLLACATSLQAQVIDKNLHLQREKSGASNYTSLTGDFNGDGKTDIATISVNGGGSWSKWAAMELSTGNGFNSTVWANEIPLHMRNGGGAPADYKIIPGDFNGDGKTDIA